MYFQYPSTHKIYAIVSDSATVRGYVKNASVRRTRYEREHV